MSRIATNKRWLEATGLALVALGAGGCELLPGLIAGGGSEPTPFSTAPLSVVVESAEGQLDGVELAPDRLVAFGSRFSSNLQFDLNELDTNTLIQVSLPSADRSDENPYFFDSEGPGGGTVPPDGIGFEEPGRFEPGEAVIFACGVASDCRQAEDFTVEIAQLAEGRAVVIEGAFGGDDRVRVTMSYREER
ncbi:MAG: hypothetical protein KF729_23430 [Sandaracinaceae bacterium]|nr:hypothetical protein [Sandaracinaceae bacterium]